MSHNLRNRLSRLEVSIKQAVPAFDWTKSPAYLALSEEDRQTLQGYADKFTAEGLTTFTDEELHDFERILMPLANEEKDNEDDWSKAR